MSDSNIQDYFKQDPKVNRHRVVQGIADAFIARDTLIKQLTDELIELKSGKYKDGLACFKENQQLTDEVKELREAVRQFIKAEDDVYNFLTSIEKSKPSHANQFSIREEKYIALKEALAKQGDSDGDI